MKLERLDRTAIRAGLLMLALLLTACGTFNRGGDNSAKVIFTNETLDQATVYASPPGSDPIRIGTVLGNQTTTLTVPTSITDRSSTTTIRVRLLARPEQPSSGPITLRAGDEIRVRLPAGAQTLMVTPGG
jgi:hypothetical protein